MTVLCLDEIIVEIVEMPETPYNITVITNDKGIRRRIGTSGAKNESVEMFLSRGSREKNKRV
ncbi:MAG: hypothetical protein LBG23_03610 [Endomicrobium sp.]|nr:hypothetical protein [Endomicrobium sp.]